MGSELLSSGERAFIVEGAAANVRSDGRSRLDYREFSLQTSVIPKANGSARLRFFDAPCDATEVTIGVIADLGSPHMHTPDQGRLEVTVQFESGTAPAAQAKAFEDRALVLTRLMQTLLADGGGLDLRKLCIVPSHHCWVLKVSCLVNRDGGNILDAISIAARTALAHTTLAAVSLSAGEGQGRWTIDVGELKEAKMVDASCVPIFVTIGKLGRTHIVDVTRQEELCCDALVSVGVKPSGAICAIQKDGHGALAPAAISAVVQIAGDAAAYVFRRMAEEGEEDEDGNDGLMLADD